MTVDPNNRPGGPHLVVTCKTANLVQFFDEATLEKAGEIAPGGSVHELVRAVDDDTVYGSVYGGGIFGKNKEPDHRIAVIDLPTRSLRRMIDVGAPVAPHGVMMGLLGTLWATAELGDALLAIDPSGGAVERVAIGGRAHWLAVSHTHEIVFAPCKTSDAVVAIDAAARKPVGRITIPQLAESCAVSPDGETLYVCAHRTPELYVIDVATRAVREVLRVQGGEGKPNQLKRVRVAPDGRHVCMSSLLDNHVAIFDAATMRQTASIATGKGPMGFGFAADGAHAFICCHDDAVVMEFALADGAVTRQFATASGCEFIVAYG